MLRLVSIASTTEMGSDGSWLKTAIFCGTSSSSTWKFSFFRLATGAPLESVTVVKTLTSLTSTLMSGVGGGDWASAPALELVGEMAGEFVWDQTATAQTNTPNTQTSALYRIARWNLLT